LFFYAAKLVWFVLQPPVALLLLLVGGLMLVAGGSPRLGGVLAGLALAGLVAAAFLPLGQVLLMPLERRFAAVEPDAPVTGLIVLGGGMQSEGGAVRMAAATQARLDEALRLARLHPEARIVVSGGSSDVVPAGGITEGAAARRWLEAQSIVPERILIEDASRNTAENARLTAAILGAQPGDDWFLVTSAFHMPRAMGSFRAAGLAPLPWPTDYRGPGAGPSERFSLVNLAIREWAGLVAYRLSGKTDTLLPGP
jgi:uncharacterized SAM-binding protein YcdF (DUF218 family)